MENIDKHGGSEESIATNAPKNHKHVAKTVRTIALIFTLFGGCGGIGIISSVADLLAVTSAENLAILCFTGLNVLFYFSAAMAIEFSFENARRYVLVVSVASGVLMAASVGVQFLDFLFNGTKPTGVLVAAIGALFFGYVVKEFRREENRAFFFHRTGAETLPYKLILLALSFLFVSVFLPIFGYGVGPEIGEEFFGLFCVLAIPHFFVFVGAMRGWSWTRGLGLFTAGFWVVLAFVMSLLLIFADGEQLAVSESLVATGFLLTCALIPATFTVWILTRPNVIAFYRKTDVIDVVELFR